MTTYDKIEDVLKMAGKALAPHEFDEFSLPMIHPSGDITRIYTAREFVGCSEATLGRRMREMVVLGRLSSKTRDGKTFKEFAIQDRYPVPTPAPETAGIHSGGL